MYCIVNDDIADITCMCTGDLSEDSDPGDLNSGDEGDTASHSSAHSSQSEAVSTQRQQQVKVCSLSSLMQKCLQREIHCCKYES